MKNLALLFFTLLFAFLKNVQAQNCGASQLGTLEVAATAVHLDWVDVPGANNYKLEIIAPSYQYIGDVNPYYSERIIYNLPAGILHTVRLTVTCDNWSQTSQETFSFTTLPIAESCPVLVAVEDFTDYTRIQISWTPILEATSYKVYVQGDPQSEMELPAGSNQYLFSGLNNNSSYTVCVEAICNGSPNQASCISTSTTPFIVCPLNLTYSAVTDESVTLEWEDTQESYRVFFPYPGPFIAEIHDSYSYTVTGLDPETTYTLCAEQLFGDDAFGCSGCVTFTTPAPSCDPPEVQDPVFGSGDATVAWNPEDFAISYKLQLHCDGNPWGPPVYNQDLIYNYTGLQENRDYTICISSICPSGESEANCKDFSTCAAGASGGISLFPDQPKPYGMNSHVIGVNRNAAQEFSDENPYFPEMLDAYGEVTPNYGSGRKLYRLGGSHIDGACPDFFDYPGYFFEDYDGGAGGPHPYDDIKNYVEEAQAMNADMIVGVNFGTGDPDLAARLVERFITQGWIDQVAFFEIGNEISEAYQFGHFDRACSPEEYAINVKPFIEAMKWKAAQYGKTIKVAVCGSSNNNWAWDNTGFPGNDCTAEIEQCADAPSNGNGANTVDIIMSELRGLVDIIAFHGYPSFPMMVPHNEPEHHACPNLDDGDPNTNDIPDDVYAKLLFASQSYNLQRSVSPIQNKLNDLGYPDVQLANTEFHASIPQSTRPNFAHSITEVLYSADAMLNALKYNLAASVNFSFYHHGAPGVPDESSNLMFDRYSMDTKPVFDLHKMMAECLPDGKILEDSGDCLPQDNVQLCWGDGSYSYDVLSFLSILRPDGGITIMVNNKSIQDQTVPLNANTANIVSGSMQSLWGTTYTDQNPQSSNVQLTNFNSITVPPLSVNIINLLPATVHCVDAVITDIKVLPDVAAPGENIQIQTSLSNPGSIASTPLPVNIYLSNDDNPSPDELIWSTVLPTLPALSTDQPFNINLSLPAGITQGGLKNIILVIDENKNFDECDECNNQFSTPITIDIPPNQPCPISILSHKIVCEEYNESSCRRFILTMEATTPVFDLNVNFSGLPKINGYKPAESNISSSIAPIIQPLQASNFTIQYNPNNGITRGAWNVQPMAAGEVRSIELLFCTDETWIIEPNVRINNSLCAINYNMTTSGGDVCQDNGNDPGFKYLQSAAAFEIEELFPNPTKDQLFFKVQVPISFLEIQTTVYDALGRKYASETWSLNRGSHTINPSISDLSNGLYYLEIKAGDQQQIRHFVKANK